MKVYLYEIKTFKKLLSLKKDLFKTQTINEKRNCTNQLNIILDCFDTYKIKDEK